MPEYESVITDDPSELAERDYYTVVYAEKRRLDDGPVSLFD